MTLSAIHNPTAPIRTALSVVCDIGGYDFFSYSQLQLLLVVVPFVVCDIGGYDFVSYSQPDR